MTAKADSGPRVWRLTPVRSPIASSSVRKCPMASELGATSSSSASRTSATLGWGSSDGLRSRTRAAALRSAPWWRRFGAHMLPTIAACLKALVSRRSTSTRGALALPATGGAP